MKKKQSGIIYMLTFFIVVLLAGGIVGMLVSLNPNYKPNTKDNENENKEYKITYKYYLDNEEVTSMVKQEKISIASNEFEGVSEEKELYAFDKYSCSNDVTGSWNNDTWEFTPNLTNDSTCKLYFIKNYHEVEVNAINGVLNNNTNKQKFLVSRNDNYITNVIPTLGYKYEKVVCTENSNAIFNSDTNDLTINNVNKDSICTITFSVSGFDIEVEANNATLSENKKTANYGDNVIFQVVPKENHTFESVVCTNGQNATFNDNVLTINGVTNNTKCNINFKYKIVKYQVNLTVENGTLLEQSKSPQTTNAYGEVSFAIDKNEGYLFTGAVLSCGNDVVESELSSNVLKIKNITKDLNCKYTLKEDTTSNE